MIPFRGVEPLTDVPEEAPPMVMVNQEFPLAHLDCLADGDDQRRIVSARYHELW